MKSIFIVAILLLTLSSIYAEEGMVLVLNAPIFHQPNMRSKVIHTYRKGRMIYIHPRHFMKNVSEDFTTWNGNTFEDKIEQDIKFELSETDEDFLDYSLEEMAKKHPVDEAYEKYLAGQNHDKFYITVDRLGNRAYIPTRFVKLVYADEREERQKIAPFVHDPTDYRFHGKMPGDYPFQKKKNYRFWGTVGAGAQAKTNYTYKGSLLQEDYSNMMEIAVALSRRIEHFKEGRVYFGGMAVFSTYSNDFSINNSSTTLNASESLLRFGLGPYISFDTFRNEKIRFTLFGSMVALFLNDVSVTLKHPDGRSVSRNFGKITVEPRVGLNFQVKDVVGKFDFILGSSLQGTLPYSMKTTGSKGKLSSEWQSGEKDIIKNPWSARFTLFLGIQLET